MLGFVGTNYKVDEGGILRFCVDVAGASRDNCVVNFPFNISVEILPGGNAGNL